MNDGIRSWGKLCTCQCHVFGKNVKHIAACCCPHRVKNRAECKECSARDNNQ